MFFTLNTATINALSHTSKAGSNGYMLNDKAVLPDLAKSATFNGFAMSAKSAVSKAGSTMVRITGKVVLDNAMYQVNVYATLIGSKKGAVKAADYYQIGGYVTKIGSKTAK